MGALTEPLPRSCREIRLWVPGHAYTKKTSQQIVRRGRFAKLLPNPNWEPWAYRLAWEAVLAIHGPPPWRGAKARDITANADPRVLDCTLYPGPVSVVAHYYPADRRWLPDLSGLLESVGDALQLARVIGNDRQIRSWDGSRVLEPRKDRPGLDVLVRELEGST